jgi:hypothetical protein
MVKAMNVKARAIAEFLAIAVGLGIIGGSQIQIIGRPPKISPEDLRAFQRNTADVNEVVTELIKEGLPAVDMFKGIEVPPTGKRISLFADLKKDPNSIYRPPESRILGNQDYSMNKEVKTYWEINNFLKEHPKAVSEKTTQRIQALNKRYNKKLKPILKKYYRKWETSRIRQKIAFKTGLGLVAVSSWQLGRKYREKRKLMRRQRK